MRGRSLKCAPLGVAEALGDTAGDVLMMRIGVVVPVDGNANRHGSGVSAFFACNTVGARASAHAPGAIIGITEIARTLRGAFRVEACLLVQRDSVRSVRAAEDVSTTTAVMTASEECKGLSA